MCREKDMITAEETNSIAVEQSGSTRPDEEVVLPSSSARSDVTPLEPVGLAASDIDSSGSGTVPHPTELSDEDLLLLQFATC